MKRLLITVVACLISMTAFATPPTIKDTNPKKIFAGDTNINQLITITGEGLDFWKTHKVKIQTGPDTWKEVVYNGTMGGLTASFSVPTLPEGTYGIKLIRDVNPIDNKITQPEESAVFQNAFSTISQECIKPIIKEIDVSKYKTNLNSFVNIVGENFMPGLTAQIFDKNNPNGKPIVENGSWNTQETNNTVILYHDKNDLPLPDKVIIKIANAYCVDAEDNPIFDAQELTLPTPLVPSAAIATSTTLYQQYPATVTVLLKNIDYAQNNNMTASNIMIDKCFNVSNFIYKSGEGVTFNLLGGTSCNLGNYPLSISAKEGAIVADKSLTLLATPAPSPLNYKNVTIERNLPKIPTATSQYRLPSRTWFTPSSR